MGRRLLDKVVYRIRIRIKASKAVPAIAETVKVSKKTIYKMRLNLTSLGRLVHGDGSCTVFLANIYQNTLFYTTYNFTAFQ